jgi:hypothetical protein
MNGISPSQTNEGGNDKQGQDHGYSGNRKGQESSTLTTDDHSVSGQTDQDGSRSAETG